MDFRITEFKEKLDQQHTFPGMYMFKFIVPSGKLEEVERLLPHGDISFRQSSKNTYTSVTLQKIVSSSDEVVEVYLSLQSVEGVIAL